MPFPGIPDPKQAGIATPPADLEVRLRSAVAALQDPPDAALRRVLAYGEVLLAANTVTNLTGAKDWDRLGPHLLDCVHAAAFLPEDLRSFFDWGSGGGMPGLVWAALFPHLEAHLGERNGKKADFLRAAADELELFEVEVHRGQGEETLPHLDPRPELVVARAVEPLGRFLKRLAGPGLHLRRLLLMVGPRWEEEWPPEAREAGPWKLAAHHEYQPDGADGGIRHLLALEARRSSPWRSRS
ncbi:MAG: 16S rRNA (guanine(527)-N(7))-methyltransferase RsmG [Planctomycetota bacterium]|jgi:16S rRNA (guanine527-N7)-methyltransferase